LVDSKSQIEHSISQVRKRDGSVSDFNRDKILNAIYRAFSASNKPDKELAIKLSDAVLIKLTEHGFSVNNPPGVESIQDLVESTLIDKVTAILPRATSCIAMNAERLEKKR